MGSLTTPYLMKSKNTSETSHDNVLYSSYPPVPIPKDKSLVRYILEMADRNVKNGRVKWMTDAMTGETTKFAEIEPMSRRIACSMFLKGMRKGDIAIYSTSNVTQIYFVMLGVWRIGGCMHSSYVGETVDNLVVKLNGTTAKWIFCDAESVSNASAAAKQVSWAVEIIVFGKVDGYTSVDKMFEVKESNVVGIPEYETDDEESPILIINTSGTTGKSKGAAYTGRNILAFCLATARFPWSSQPILYLIKSTHITGALNPFRNIFVGLWSVSLVQITPENTLCAIEQYQPFAVFALPPYLLQIVRHPEATKYDRSSIEFVCIGGMIVTAQMIEDLMTLPKIKKVLQGLGMSECCGVTASVDLSFSEKWRPLSDLPMLSAGKLYPNVALKLLDLATGNSLGPNMRGSISIKSPAVCIGYWSENKVQRPTDTFSEDWINTGDIGYYDANGFVFVTGRVKETIKYLGNLISPEELEDVLLTHGSIAEACVFGVDDEAVGSIPRAVIVLKPGRSASAEDIQDFVNGVIPWYKRLRGGVFIVPALPLGPSGKVMRSLVAKMPLPESNATNASLSCPNVDTDTSIAISNK